MAKTWTWGKSLTSCTFIWWWKSQRILWYWWCPLASHCYVLKSFTKIVRCPGMIANQYVKRSIINLVNGCPYAPTHDWSQNVRKTSHGPIHSRVIFHMNFGILSREHYQPLSLLKIWFSHHLKKRHDANFYQIFRFLPFPVFIEVWRIIFFIRMKLAKSHICLVQKLALKCVVLAYIE